MTSTKSLRPLSVVCLCLLAFVIAVETRAQSAPQLTSDLLSEFNWRLIGPSSPAGRVWQVVGDENNPKTFYVCTAGGGLWKSTDNGTTLLPIFDNQTSASTGAVAIARSNSNIVWVGTGEPANTRANSWGDGVYKSADAGKTWAHMGLPESRQISSIVIHPTRPNTVYVAAMGYEWGRNDERGIFKTTDGGKTLRKANMKHVHNDQHGIWIDPRDPEHLIMGGDGGVNISYNRGATWQQAVLPIGQFYEVAVDNQDPYHVYGGMQDTGHWRGPSQTYDNEGITNHDWIKLRFNGDGMAVAADPRDPNVIYMVQEFGNFSRLDLRTWDRTELLPDPAEAKKRGLHSFRYDWTPPMIMSAHDPDVLYLGSNYLFKFTKQGAKWDVISPDLTAQQDQVLKGSKKDYTGYHSYGALFSIAESPLDAKVIWTGADDGPVYVTRDGGSSWTNVTENFPSGAPTYAVVGEIEASRFDKGAAYVAYDAHTREDHKPYLYFTNDYGKTWTDITGDLPHGGSSYVIREDPVNRDLLFVGTEFGVYLTIDRGRHWVQLKNNLPTVGVRAMTIQPREHDLVVGTFGRAIWITDIAPFEQMNARVLAQPAHLFDVKPGTLFKTRYTYGATIEELNGDMFFRAENPPYGTAITYYLRESVGAEVTLTITDKSGKTVRALKGPGAAGLHRVVWDLKRPEKVTDEEATRARAETLSERDALAWVPPGDYMVTLELSSGSLKTAVNVRKEAQGVKRVNVRK